MLPLLVAAALALAPASAPARVVIACPSSAVQTTALPVTLPIEVWSNHIYVKVCVAEHALDFILDTGAGATSLDLNVARQLGVHLGQTFTVGGAGAGRVAGARVENASVALDGLSIVQPIATAIDLSRLSPREGHRMDGILGYDFIARYVLAIDYERSELRIYDRDRFHYNGSGTSVPVTLIDRFPIIDAAITLGERDTLRGRFVVDVGSGAALTLRSDRRFAARAVAASEDRRRPTSDAWRRSRSAGSSWRARSRSSSAIRQASCRSVALGSGTSAA
jgi:hypothetical protein